MRLVLVLLAGIIFLAACQKESPRIPLNPPQVVPSEPKPAEEPTTQQDTSGEQENVRASLEAKRVLHPDGMIQYSFVFSSPEGNQSGYRTITSQGNDISDQVVQRVDGELVWNTEYLVAGVPVTCRLEEDGPRCYEFPRMESVPGEEPGIPEGIGVSRASRPAGLSFDAECFSVDDPTVKSVWCYDAEGHLVFLRESGDGFKHELIATSISDEMPGDAFEFPAPTIRVPESWLRK